jgi:hypothetical protein
MGIYHDDIECVALDLIERFGDSATSISRELAEIANHPYGEILSAEGWQDITDAIEQALREGVTGRRVDAAGSVFKRTIPPAAARAVAPGWRAPAR